MAKRTKRSREEEWEEEEDDFEEENGDYEDDEDEEEEEEEEEEDDSDDDDDDEDDDEEDDDDEEEEEEEEEEDDPPDKKRKKRKPTTATAFTYTVQKGFELDGREYAPGDSIPVRCQTCALWERKWLGTVFCHDSAILNKETGETMSPDKFSCGSFYINVENERQLKDFFEMGLDNAETVRKLLATFKKYLEAQQKILLQAKEKGDDVTDAVETAKAWLENFTHPDQVFYIEKFVREHNKRAKARLTSRVKRFNTGDWVSWKDPIRGELEGIIYKIHKGDIRLAVTGGPKKSDRGGKATYEYKKWRDEYSPEVLEKAEE